MGDDRFDRRWATESNQIEPKTVSAPSRQATAERRPVRAAQEAVLGLAESEREQQEGHEGATGGDGDPPGGPSRCSGTAVSQPRREPATPMQNSATHSGHRHLLRSSGVGPA